MRADAESVEGALESFSTRAMALDLKAIYGRARPVPGVGYFFSRPSSGGACKRLNLFLRWLVRRDAVDLGLWRAVRPAQLVVPLDTHIIRVGRCLGMTDAPARAGGWRIDITRALRQLNPDDPVRYDFSMCHLGMGARAGSAPLGPTRSARSGGVPAAAGGGRRDERRVPHEGEDADAGARRGTARRRPPFKNYITPAGHRRLSEELARLWKMERPALVTTVTWAAANGDRSENGDYLYGKRKLREIDGRLRYLSKSLDNAVVVDNAGKRHERVFFGATVTFQPERRRRARRDHRRRRRARCRRRAHLVAFAAGHGVAEGPGRRRGDAAHAARARAAGSRGDPLRRGDLSGRGAAHSHDGERLACAECRS